MKIREVGENRIIRSFITCTLRQVHYNYNVKVKGMRLAGRLARMGGDIIGSWRNLHNGELHILYSFPNKIRRLKSRRMSWAWNVARRNRSA
jgi:hypothetical protein